MQYPVLTTNELRRQAARLPRVDLAHLPTPLEEVPRFAERVGGVRIFIKRDDCTGLLFGGNKTRHNEFILADALHQGCDMLVWGAGVQSNNCRQTAAACAKLGLECRLFLGKGKQAVDVQGNLLLDYLVGAKVDFVEAELGPQLEEILHAKAEYYRHQGHKPYVWDRHRVPPIAAVSYALCLAEIVDELQNLNIKPAAIYASSCGSTGAGLALGKLVLAVPYPVRSILPIRWPWDTREAMAETVNRGAILLDLPHRLAGRDIEATEDYIGAVYGQMTDAGWEAMDLLARTEGILLDHVYTAKAMAALVDDIRHRRIPPGETVVFVHTGGQTALFACRDELMSRVRLGPSK
jgi:1-aminocyclopropane-1-carboxylate deaminase/D-cysteine desulfhydrase-like pyridoxal-dependent ACC family enzyme